jgi:hypothetical protein
MSRSIRGAGDDYIDLANTYLFVEAQIIEDDDIALDGGADVGPVNLWMHFYFDFYTSDGVFTAGLFQSFDVTHSYGRT